ncbi:MAG TPA: PqqD family protein [Gemmatimonadales bacterium]|nr:PqqD family protein [Gemmatimonadales bacterium]
MTIVFRRHPDLRLTSLEGEGVGLHLGARRYFTVNATGLTVLEALASPKAFEELVDSILGEYDVGRSQAIESARAFVDQCRVADILIEEGR